MQCFGLARPRVSKVLPRRGAHINADPFQRLTPQRSGSVRTMGLPRRAQSHSGKDTARTIKQTLQGGDAFCMLVGYAVPLLWLVDVKPRNFLFGLVEILALFAAGMYSVRFQRLWSQRVVTVRMVELSRILRAFVMTSCLALIIDRKATMDLRIWDLVVASVIGVVSMIAWRSAYRAYLAAERRRGRMLTRVVLVGTERRAFDLCRLFEIHPELGMRVVALVGDRSAARGAGIERLWKGDYLAAREVLSRARADSVIICSADLDPALMHDLTQRSEVRSHSLYVDPGLPGVDFRRVQPTALAHQPLLEVESASLPAMEQSLKRVFDIAIAVVMSIVLLPVAAAIAAVIKLEDGGPVFFRQQRVGRHDVNFGVFKFRTMVVDAEARLAALQTENERKGPLFKMDRDPRVTRIGGFLRATSLDELPQLINVLWGQMSLVGPRPALPAEVLGFPEELRARHDVRPGITGLWQVEARDNPSFEAYRRLDLFYVENWSTVLDMVILVSTFDQVLFRPFLSRLYRNDVGDATDDRTPRVTLEPGSLRDPVSLEA